MSKSAWSVLGVLLAFCVIQSCGGEDAARLFGPTGVAPLRDGGDAAPPYPDEQQHLGGFTEDGGYPAYDYDDGGSLWDGGEPIALEPWRWNQTLIPYRGRYGQRYRALCTPVGSEYAVWGSNPYTDDSPPCTAAEHQGLIDRERGGFITVEIRPAQHRFEGHDQNGVIALSWGPFPGSFRVVR